MLEVLGVGIEEDDEADEEGPGAIVSGKEERFPGVALFETTSETEVVVNGLSVPKVLNPEGPAFIDVVVIPSSLLLKVWSIALEVVGAGKFLVTES